MVPVVPVVFCIKTCAVNVVVVVVVVDLCAVFLSWFVFAVGICGPRLCPSFFVLVFFGSG